MTLITPTYNIKETRSDYRYKPSDCLKWFYSTIQFTSTFIDLWLNLTTESDLNYCLFVLKNYFLVQ